MKLNKIENYFLDSTNNTKIESGTLLLTQTSVASYNIKVAISTHGKWIYRRVCVNQNVPMLVQQRQSVEPFLTNVVPQPGFQWLQRKLSATLTGRVNSTFRRACMIEYTSSLHCSKVSSTVTGKAAIAWTAVLAHFSFHSWISEHDRQP